MSETLRIATRASRLALWQAEFVRQSLQALEPHLAVELVHVVSSGDIVRDRPLHEMGGVGIFTKEVQDALLDGRADIAVHSLKDLPTESHPSLVLAAVPERGPIGDVLLSPRHGTIASLPSRAIVATSSLRRRAQLLRHRPDLTVVDIRGNVETRIRKLHDERLDALVLAAAGLARLGLESEITEHLEAEIILPAVGQGALGIECRAEDQRTISLLQQINHLSTRQCVDAERALLHEIQGGCQVPLGAKAQNDGGTLRLHAIVLSPDGKEWVEGSSIGDAEQATAVGTTLAEKLLRNGAGRLIRPAAF